MNTIIKSAIYSTILAIVVSCSPDTPENSIDLNRNASIFPDYNGVTIPNNIAPLNFVIREKATKYIISIAGNSGQKINIASNDGNIQIPLGKWQEFTKANSGAYYKVDIYANQGGKWNHFNTITNHIAPDPIDGYLMYRFINPANILWNKMGIYQRCLENFEVSPIMDNALTDNNCMHCHSVAANNPEYFMLHMRGKPGGTVIYADKKLKFIDTKTPQTIAPGGYPSWHPSGKIIAFSTNKISQRFHALKEKYAFVYDAVSDIELFFVDNNEIQAIPKLNTSDFENIPSWSPDGKYLYFISTPKHNPDTVGYQNIKYSLKRISYDINTNHWGDVETLVDAQQTGKSYTFPRVTADNKYVVMCEADYGYFTVYNETSDIVIFDLENRQLMHPDINSKDVESYPSWSSNNKWIIYTSKRDDGLSSRPYFAYFNDGKTAKPFVLPQKDAMWNFEEINNINRPELVKTKIELNPQQILSLVKNAPMAATFNEKSLTSEVPADTTKSDKSSNAFNFDQ